MERAILKSVEGKKIEVPISVASMFGSVKPTDWYQKDKPETSYVEQDENELRRLETVKKISNLCAIVASPGIAAMCRQMGEDTLMGKMTYSHYVETLEAKMVKNKKFRQFLHSVLEAGRIKEKEVTSNGKSR